MSRPNRSQERRKKLVPRIAGVFAEYGYRRTTTSRLASELGVAQNTLFRLWGDKKSMFLAAIQYVYQASEERWSRLLEDHEKAIADQVPSPNGKRQRKASTPGLTPENIPSLAQTILAFEAQRHGQGRMYRIVFAGLSETDDPEIHQALMQMFFHYHQFIAARIHEHRHPPGSFASGSGETPLDIARGSAGGNSGGGRGGSYAGSGGLGHHRAGVDE